MTSNVAGGVVLFVLIAIVLFAGIWAMDTGVSEQSTETDVDNETVQRTDGWNSLAVDGDRYAVFSVQEETTGDALVRGEDYWVDKDEGALEFSETGGNVSVDYKAASMPNQTARNMGVLDPILSVGGWLPYIGAVAAILVGLTALQRGGRGGAY